MCIDELPKEEKEQQVILRKLHTEYVIHTDAIKQTEM